MFYTKDFYLLAKRFLLELFLESVCPLVASRYQQKDVLIPLPLRGMRSSRWACLKVSPKWPLQFQIIQRLTRFSRRYKILVHSRNIYRKLLLIEGDGEQVLG